MIPILGICGASNSGKTTLLKGVTARLAELGLKVGVIKHHGHGRPLPVDEPGKDTTLLLEAGAARALLVHAGGLKLTAGPAEAAAPPLELASRLLGDMDLVLVEGFKTAELDKIEVAAPGREPLLPSGGRVVAIARRGGGEAEAGRPVLDADQPDLVARFILNHLRAQADSVQAPPVHLSVAGAEVKLTPFVARILDNTLRGLVGTLQGGDQAAGRIEVRLG